MVKLNGPPGMAFEIASFLSRAPGCSLDCPPPAMDRKIQGPSHLVFSDTLAVVRLLVFIQRPYRGIFSQRLQRAVSEEEELFLGGGRSKEAKDVSFRISCVRRKRCSGRISVRLAQRELDLSWTSYDCAAVAPLSRYKLRLESPVGRLSWSGI